MLTGNRIASVSPSAGGQRDKFTINVIEELERSSSLPLKLYNICGYDGFSELRAFK